MRPVVFLGIVKYAIGVTALFVTAAQAFTDAIDILLTIFVMAFCRHGTFARPPSDAVLPHFLVTPKLAFRKWRNWRCFVPRYGCSDIIVNVIP